MDGLSFKAASLRDFLEGEFTGCIWRDNQPEYRIGPRFRCASGEA
jgi:hypothetical protein